MKYFTFKEFEVSSTAKQKHIDNSIPENYKSRIEELVNEILDPLRAAWGSPLRITSGYRSPALNKAVKGSSTSAHCGCYAADIQPSNGKIDEFCKFAYEFLQDKSFDQCINEYSGNSRWLHIGIRNNSGKQRK